MAIDKSYIDLFHKVAVKAAYASYHLVGKKDKIAADQAAVDAMRNELNKIEMNGQIVIGEGELDEAPMLYIGEKLGTGNGPSLDIAVDPLEGTNFAANNLPGALSVIAVAEKSNLFNAPETYMNKIAADKAAVDAMRNELNKIEMNGQIVIGEGELDKAPMLYIGEKLGTGNGPNLDIAVDPLEGTNFAANNLPGALSVIAVAEKSNLFNAPETYMEKIAT